MFTDLVIVSALVERLAAPQIVLLVVLHLLLVVLLQHLVELK